jgi:hypothetical protein
VTKKELRAEREKLKVELATERARATAAAHALLRVEALRDEWLTDHGDWQGRPRSWWDEKPYGEELRAALDGDK